MGAGIIHGALDGAELAALGVRPEGLLDFSSNLNPFGPPHGVRAALAALEPAPYPDRSCLHLREQLALQHKCDTTQVLVGNGANELIHLTARTFLHPSDAALVVAPTFGEYAHACRLADAQVVEWHAGMKPPFAFDVHALTMQIQQQCPRLTWLCAPNNPTGVDLSSHDVDTIAAACASHSGLLVIDQAYYALRRQGDCDYVVDMLPHVLRLHSLTKSYALAGLRIGYLLGEATLLARIALFQPTWSVNSAAQAAALTALQQRAFLQTTMPRLWAASDELIKGIEQLGLETWRGALPFLLVRVGNGAATRLALLRRNCVVRDCASFGLAEWVRVAPRTTAENERLLQAWKETL